MLCLHDDGRIFCAEEQTAVIDACHKLKILLLEGSDGAGTDNARVGHHNIQTAEFLYNLGHHVCHALLIGYVYRDGIGTLAHLHRHLLSQRVIHIRNDDRRAFLIKFLSDTFAEALSRSGHDGDLACQTAGTRRTVVDVFFCNFLPFCHVYTHDSLSVSLFILSCYQPHIKALTNHLSCRL